jgi:uracil-DNA glycosylase
MKNQIPYKWQKVLLQEFDKPYFIELEQKVNQAYANNLCLPLKKEIFNAFNYCDFDNLKVVIIGQDPYPTPCHAHGLCFSVEKDVQPLPKSLINIFKEIETDLGKEFPKNGNLERWAKQGVFLINTILTVQAGETNSHKNFGWQKFTNAVIKTISDQKKNVVFLLWGGPAKLKAKLINPTKHKILTSGHPSPLSANRGYWFGNKHFSQTNTFLESKALIGIDW